MTQTTRQADPVYVVDVDLRGSKLASSWRSVRHLMDGRRASPERLRQLAAEHYGVPLSQVSAPRLTTEQAFNDQDDSALSQLELNTFLRARQAMTDGYNDTPPEATHGDGLDAALAAAVAVIRTRIMEQRTECRSAGQHDAVEALTNLLAELS